MSESILQSVKHDLSGITPEYTHFDPDIVRDINAALVILHEMGVGDEIKEITGPNETWEDLFGDDKRMNLIKPWLKMKVQLVFDSSSYSGPVLDSIKRQLDEYEWRINEIVDP